MTPLQEASSPRTAPARLRELAQQGIALAVAVIENPGAPPELKAELRAKLFQPNRKRREEPDDFFLAPLLEEASATSTPPSRLSALSQVHPSLALSVARNPGASPALLQTLSKHPEPLVVCAVAQHPKTSATLLSHLAKTGKRSVRRAIASCHRTPPTVLRELLQAFQNQDVLRDVVQNAATSSAQILLLWRDGARRLVRIALRAIQAANDTRYRQLAPFLEFLRGQSVSPRSTATLALEELSSEVLEAFIYSGLSYYQQYRAARDPNTRLSLLLWLGTSTDYTIRRALAENKRAPLEQIPELANDASPESRQQAAAHPQTEPEDLARLAQDEHLFVRLAVANHPRTPPQTLSALAEDIRMQVALAALSNPNLPEESLLTHAERQSHPTQWQRNDSEHQAIVRRPDLSARVLLLLTQNPHFQIQFEVARHPNVNEEVLSRLARSTNQTILSWVASHPKTNSETLTRLSQTGDESVQLRVAAHPNTPEEVLRALSQRGRQNIYAALLQRERLSEEILLRIAVCDTIEHRLRVVARPEVTEKILAILSNDKNPRVKKAAAAHPKTPKPTTTRRANTKKKR